MGKSITAMPNPCARARWWSALRQWCHIPHYISTTLQDYKRVLLAAPIKILPYMKYINILVDWILLQICISLVIIVIIPDFGYYMKTIRTCGTTAKQTNPNGSDTNNFPQIHFSCMAKIVFMLFGIYGGSNQSSIYRLTCNQCVLGRTIFI